MNFLTIDTGTTNTRVSLWRDSQVIATAQAAVGVRDTAISGSRALLQSAVQDTISETLQTAGLVAGDISLAVASGMITSGLGLHEVPHCAAPAGLAELAAGMVQQHVPEVFAHPIWFVPGVRNNVSPVTLRNCESMDMMRGEEVEVIGLLARLALSSAALFVMPGSHTKLVRIDCAGRIMGCATTLAGELLQTLTHQTILAKSLDSEFATDLDATMVRAGAQSANRTGLGRTCFSLRILDQFDVADRNARANFLLGAVLASDLLTLKNSTALGTSSDTPLVIAGRGVVQQALNLLISDDPFFTLAPVLVNSAQQMHLAGFGAARVAAARGLLPASLFV